MAKRNVDLANRAIIEELNKKGYTSASIKQIMQRRLEIIVSKRGIQKNY